MNNRADVLVQNIPESIRRTGQSKIDTLRDATKAIYDSLAVITGEYSPKETIERIAFFVPTTEDKTFRVMYSEINNSFMLLDDTAQSRVLANAEMLLQHIAENETHEKIIQIIFKIYDHLQLINSQIDCTEKIVDPQLKDIREKMRADSKEDLKNVEREHVTILGIFAAIVLAFVGTFAFSTSVLNNIGKAPFCELLVIAIVIVVGFCFMIRSLLDFLREISGMQRR